MIGNIVLSHLLTPAIFGIMLIFNTIRTGVELFSDVGISQSVVASPDGSDPRFYSTAWTVQVIRGFAIAAVTVAISPVVIWFYGDNLFGPALLILACLFMVSGFHSPGRILLQRNGEMKRVSLFEFVAGAVTMALQLAICWYDRSVWSLMYGAVACSFVLVVLSFIMTPAQGLRLQLDKAHAWQIVSFGKWIFASSLIFFAAANFDRIYLSAAIPFAVLGVYGIARSLSELLTTLVGRVGTMLVFPIVAQNAHDPIATRAKMTVYYAPVLIAAAVALAAFTAVSDLLIRTIYDARYAQAAAILPVLAAGVWFSILATLSDSILLGMRKPAYTAVGNLVKLVWLVATAPFLGVALGFPGVVLSIACADLTRCVTLSLYRKRSGMGFGVVDLAATIVFVLLTLTFRAVGRSFGVVGPISDLWSLFQ